VDPVSQINTQRSNYVEPASPDGSSFADTYDLEDEGPSDELLNDMQLIGEIDSVEDDGILSFQDFCRLY